MTTSPALLAFGTPGLAPSPTGVTVDLEVADHATVIGALTNLSRAESWSRWVVGDLFAALVELHDGDTAAAIVEVAGLGYSTAWLTTSIEVAARVPAAHRRSDLSFGHHEVVARDTVPVDDQPRWLADAKAMGWTVRQLAQAVDEWERRDQGELEGTGGRRSRPWRLPPRVARRVGEIVAADPDAWVLVHPSTGEVRRYANGTEEDR